LTRPKVGAVDGLDAAKSTLARMSGLKLVNVIPLEWSAIPLEIGMAIAAR